MSTYRVDRRSRRDLAALWKPEYDHLARFNSEKYRGLAHDPSFVEQMRHVQRDYEANYVPAARNIEAEGKWRRCWL